MKLSDTHKKFWLIFPCDRKIKLIFNVNSAVSDHWMQMNWPHWF